MTRKGIVRGARYRQSGSVLDARRATYSALGSSLATSTRQV